MSSRSFSLFSFLAVTTILALLALAPMTAQAGDNSTYSYARIVRLSYVSGDVQIVRTDKGDKWEPAVLNMPVEQGFAIGTNNGRAEIELEHGCTIWLAENSVLQFTELALSSGGRITRMTLSQGTATFDASLAGGDALELTTPSFKATPLNKAEFRVDMLEHGGAVTVLNGKLSVSDASGSQDVPKGQTFEANAKATQTAIKRSPSPDEWDHWVSGRLNGQLSVQNQTSSYANAPFTYGMTDMAAYGSWNYFPGYGYGWQPFGMSAGWAPFTAGQWNFYPSLGWTWLSSEPWGWVPYHFGGWQYSSSFGWMWMPGDYGMWTAAPVNWVGVGNQVGWVPRPVTTLRSASTATPVIVASKNLGKEGKNRVFSAEQVSTRMQPLAGAPGEKGKPAVSAEAAIARVVVPTAANLGALRAGVTTNAAAKIDVNALHSSAVPAVAREFTPMNGAMAAPKMPGRPPAHAAFTTGDTAEFSLPGQPSTTMTTRTAPAPAQTSQKSSTSSTAASGKPH